MRKNNFLRKSFKNIKKTTAKLLPKVRSGLENIGKFVASSAAKSIPIVKKGIKNVSKRVMKTRKHK